MHSKNLDYSLPEALIAQKPAKPRDSSRLCVVDRQARSIKHRSFRDLVEFLRPGDVLVMNDSKTLHARVYGTKSTGGKVEVLFLEPSRDSQHGEDQDWTVLARPGLRVGAQIQIEDRTFEVVDTHGYTRTLRQVDGPNSPAIQDWLEVVGHLPLPPYITTEDEEKLETQYQTVYASSLGSVATPTAGLHFSAELLEELRAAGVQLCTVTLHVGLGTFLPITTETIEEHEMHQEWYSVSQETMDTIRSAKQSKNRVIAVGTTTTRVLESIADEILLDPETQTTTRPKTTTRPSGCSGYTKLFIRPPFRWRVLDGLITNLHLPKSTLLLLVMAFADPDSSPARFLDSFIGGVYLELIEEEYRFYSLGDAMLIL